MRITDKHVFFWGGPFSNFRPAPFSLEGHEFKTSEQYFMWKKAITFKDDQTAEEILKAETPKEAKALGRKVKCYDDKIWSSVRERIMEDAVYAKFTSNPDLREELLRHDGKTFVEASPWDGIWGIKMKEDDPEVDDEGNWKGQNLLGKVLGKVRERIKKEEG